MVMAKIRELEATLKMAVVIDGSVTNSLTVHIGSRVEILDSSSNKKFQYQLVEPNEASPLTGKISIASPVGAAILGHAVGDKITVETPRGKQTYVIEKTT
jgi:transcription elongation factor GreA